ncbi:hypothetical protein [Antarcticimicrobium luteum]|uniref:Uncharacterized protein n=1 Tax=Antarcticimicrobium luteum TaxID=2547397 RepID=A0A4R5VFA6_9RHOB|nr:hypothetical protein [Antarcticimicrobium luteum]TDK51191.1 hypothetical protein E1832_04280 [Antarcticimicrobium luteum]
MIMSNSDPHSWIISVFEDIREYARLNGLKAVEGSADIGRYVAMIELYAGKPDGMPAIPYHLTSFERYKGLYDDVSSPGARRNTVRRNGDHSNSAVPEK